MTITWADLRTKIRRSILEDTGATPKWSDDSLLDCVQWALDQFCAHTAYFKSYTIDATTEKSPGVFYDMALDTEFALPDDIFEYREYSVRVVVISDTGARTILYPVDYSTTNNNVGYRFISNNLIEVNVIMSESDSLYIEYFAYYPEVVDDATEILIPRWAHGAIAYLAGAHAMTQKGISSANIDRWKDKTDAGNPEHNAFRAQQKWLLSMYDNEVAKYSIQDRLNRFRKPK